MKQFSLVNIGSAITILAAMTTFAAQSNSFLEKLATYQNVKVLQGKTQVFYSPDTPLKNVSFVQELITEATQFFLKAEPIKTDIKMYAAILNKTDWETLAISEEVGPGMSVPMEYGLTTLTDDHLSDPESKGPFGAIIGSPVFIDKDGDGNDDNAITAGNLNLLRRLPAERQARILQAGFGSIEQAAREMPLLIGIHEMGHVYARKMGISFFEHGSHNIDEMLASFYLYAFLNERQKVKGGPNYVTLWDEVLDSYLTRQCPTLKTKELFDLFYLGVADPQTGGSFENFLFFQGQAQKLGKKFYDKYGINFLSRFQRLISDHKPQTARDLYALMATGEDAELFTEWSDNFSNPPGCSTDL